MKMITLSDRMTLFRGKTVLTNMWVYGSYMDYPTPCIQMGPAIYEVHPETVGQYIGLKDINDEMLFEHDYIEFYNCSSRTLTKGVVKFESASFYIDSMQGFTFYRWIDYAVKKIGNLHDNPKMLEQIQIEY